MITHFITFEWKQFFRSSSFGKGIAVRLFLGIIALYFIIMFLLIGAGSYFYIKKQYPTQDPLYIINTLLIYVIMGDLIFRYLMQKLPVMNIKPLLLLPIKKRTLIHYILGKSALSFFNVMSLFFYVPFAVVLLEEGYDFNGVLGWLFFMLLSIQLVNFLNFLINKNKAALKIMVTLIVAIYFVETYNLFPIGAFFGDFFQAIYTSPGYSVIGLIPLISIYSLNYKVLAQNIYLDTTVKEQVTGAKSTDLSILNRLGDLAPFIKNDIRLIMRNKRTKSVFFMSFLFLLYGLLFFTMDAYKDQNTFLVFVCIFITGGFTINYGQFIPAWDSEHYGLLMSQNISYRKFLESKWYLMVLMTVFLFILSTPYLYFGIENYLLIAAGAFFNIGFSSLLMLYIGSFNRKRIDLTKSGFSNMQGTSAVQFIVLIPIMLFPMLIYASVNYFFGFHIAIGAIASVGILSFLFKNTLMTIIERRYKKNKYAVVHAFKQKN